MIGRSWNKRRAALFADAPPSASRERRRELAGPRPRGARLPRRLRAEAARAVALSAGTASPTAPAGVAVPKPRAGRRVPWLGLVLGLVLAGLGLAALRTELVRLQYELGTVAAEETALREQLASSAATARTVRDPRRLRELAEEMGFGPAERVIDLRPGRRLP